MKTCSRWTTQTTNVPFDAQGNSFDKTGKLSQLAATCRGWNGPRNLGRGCRYGGAAGWDKLRFGGFAKANPLDTTRARNKLTRMAADENNPAESRKPIPVSLVPARLEATD